MQCYLCGSTGIEKEGKIYCPSCDIFIADKDKGEAPYVQPLGNTPLVEEKEKVQSFHIPFPRVRILVIFGIILLAIGWFIFANFVYIDSKNNCSITILPAWFEWSNMNLKRALLTLKYGAPEHYKLVCDNVKSINPAVGCGGFEGGCYYPRQVDTIYVSTSQRSLSWSAAVIAHETCHVIQAKEGKAFDETECYREDSEVLKQLIEF